jgi:hypothetical protein
LVIAIALIALMIVALLATMLPIAQITAVHNKKMSYLLLFWLLIFLGDFLKNAGCFIGSLTLLGKGNKMKQVCGHHLVCLCKLELMHLGLHKEDLFALLLHCGQLHHLTDVVTIKVAEELYSTPHELMNWLEGGLLGGAKPADQLVANIGEPGDCLKVIPAVLIEVCLCTVCFGGALLWQGCSSIQLDPRPENTDPSGWTVLNHRPSEHLKVKWNLWLEIVECEHDKVLRSKSCLVRRDVSRDFLGSFLEEDLDSIRVFQAFFDQLVWHAIGTQRSPASVPVKLGCLLSLDKIRHCHNLGL